MELPNPKELKALLKVCRDFGVDTVKFGPIEVKFGELPKGQPEPDEAATGMAGISPEDLAMWSVHDPMEGRNQ